jgi:hypothetical protein
MFMANKTRDNLVQVIADVHKSLLLEATYPDG